MFAPFQTSGTVKPSATVNTYGSPISIVSNTGYGKLQLSGIGINVTTIGAETLTFSISATRADGTTATVTTTATATGETDINVGDLFTLMGDINWITSLSVMVKSSIVTSTGVATVYVLGSEFPLYGDRNY